MTAINVTMSILSLEFLSVVHTLTARKHFYLTSNIYFGVLDEPRLTYVLHEDQNVSNLLPIVFFLYSTYNLIDTKVHLNINLCILLEYRGNVVYYMHRIEMSESESIHPQKNIMPRIYQGNSRK